MEHLSVDNPEAGDGAPDPEPAAGSAGAVEKSASTSAKGSSTKDEKSRRAAIGSLMRAIKAQPAGAAAEAAKEGASQMQLHSEQEAKRRGESAATRIQAAWKGKSTRSAIARFPAGDEAPVDIPPEVKITVKRMPGGDGGVDRYSLVVTAAPHTLDHMVVQQHSGTPGVGAFIQSLADKLTT